MLRSPLGLSLAFLLGSGCMVGPSVVRRTDFDREMEQFGLVAAPSGVHALGPMVEPHTVSFEGQLSSAAQAPAMRTRDGGATGMLLAHEWARARVATGLQNGVELGFELEGSPLALAQPMATDLPEGQFTGVLGRGGSQLRWRSNQGEGAYFGAQLEVSGGLYPYEHTETLVSTDTTYDRGVATQVKVSTDTMEAQRVLLYWTLRAGSTFGWVTERGWDFSVGMSTENLPEFYGSNDATWGCTWYSDGTSSCMREPRKLADVRTRIAQTGSVTLGIPFEGTALTLITNVNGHFGPSRMTQAAPLSGTVVLRVSPGKGQRDREASLKPKQ